MGIGVYFDDKFCVPGKVFKYNNKLWIICEISNEGFILLKRTNWRGKMVEIVI
jgi:hypothetical protein